MIETPKVVSLKLNEIKPYEQNPRRISKEAVDAVRQSLERYGYQQPLVVDKDHVLVVGHTRYQAMIELGVKDAVPVFVTDLPEEKVREYRLIDNKTSEMGQWDHSALVIELREFEDELLDTYFSDIDLEVDALEDAMITDEDIDKATAKIASVGEDAPVHTTEVICPACSKGFHVKTGSLPGISRADLENLTNDGTEG